MTYYETPGVLEDIADFMVDYYNEEYIIKRCSIKYNEAENNFMEFSKELKSVFGGLPEELHPFAYSSDKTVAFITSITKTVDFTLVTFEKFLEYMFSTKFLNDFCHYWFNIEYEIKQIEDIENYKLTELLQNLQHPEDIKYKLFIVLSCFEQCRNKFIKILTDLSGYVLQLRERNRALIEKSIELYDSDFFYSKFNRVYSKDISDYAFSVSMVNSGLVYYEPKREIIWLGAKANIHLKQKKTTNLQTFSFIFNDPLRVKIVDFVHRNQPLTRECIYNWFSEQSTILNFQIDLLMEEGILLRKLYPDGLLYLTINQEYFSRIPNVFQKTFGLKQKGEDNP